MKLANDWKDYNILDMADGQKLEQWGDVILSRPDPQVIWTQKEKPDLWKKTNATYIRSNSGGGSWSFKNKLDKFEVKYKDLKFFVKPLGFKHMGLFPEQAYNWDFIIDEISKAKKKRSTPIKVLNLFAYTGGATVAASYAGADVVHVDSSKGMTSMAKENVDANVSNAHVRYIIDDVIKFMQREIRRGNKYDAIIMDPPSYGRGPKGEVWRFEENINQLLDLTKELLSDNPLFIIINSYTTGYSPYILKTLMAKKFDSLNGSITCDEIGLPVKDSSMILPCGMTGRWIHG